MFIITTTDNPIVFAWYTYVEFYGYKIEDVPEQWGLRAAVQRRIEEEKNKQK